MKKTITLLTLAACGIFISHAQITIYSYDVVLSGKVLHQANDTLKPLSVGAINPGPAGAGKTWNFSNLLAGTIDTLTMTNPGWLPSGASFPNSNLAGMSTDGSVLFLENKGNGLFVDGAYADFTGQGATVVKFNPTEELTSFPNTYNSTFQNTSGLSLTVPFTGVSGVDSAKLKERKFKNVLTDGWGNITTPLGTYPCLRQKGMVITTDSIWLHSNIIPIWTFFTTTTDTVWHFTWWASGVGLPLLEFDSTAGDTIRNIVWLKTTPVLGGVHENAAFNGVTTYPNPSAGKVTLSLPNTVSAGSAEVFNSMGEKVVSLPVVGGKENSVDLTRQPEGIYFMRITSNEGVATRKIVVSR